MGLPGFWEIPHTLFPPEVCARLEAVQQMAVAEFQKQHPGRAPRDLSAEWTEIFAACVAATTDWLRAQHAGDAPLAGMRGPGSG